MDTLVVEVEDDDPDHAQDHLQVVLDDVADLGHREPDPDVLHELEASVDVGSLGVDVLGGRSEGGRALPVVERPDEEHKADSVVKVRREVLYGRDRTLFEVVVDPASEGLHLLLDPLLFAYAAPAP